jgi:hypothetical protein
MRLPNKWTLPVVLTVASTMPLACDRAATNPPFEDDLGHGGVGGDIGDGDGDGGEAFGGAGGQNDLGK